MLDLLLFLLRDPRRWNAIMALVGLLGASWIWLSMVPEAATTGGLVPIPREGFPAPDFTLSTLSGEEITLSSLRGQVVILNLWTSWCPPCREEMPTLDQIYNQYRDQGLVVLGLNSTFQDDEAAVEDAVTEWGLTFPILLDRSGAVSKRYRLQALPTTFFIDRRGVIRSVVLGGPMTTTAIRREIGILLMEDS